MRLFLSSQNFGKYPERFLDLMGENKKLAYVGNAKDKRLPYKALKDSQAVIVDSSKTEVLK